MEKLQIALNKARKTRQEGSGVQTAQVHHRKARSSRENWGETAWAELRSADLDAALLTRNRITTHVAQAASAPFDILRTKILMIMQQNGWKRLAITSPDQNCGKTTVAANLAIGFSRQGELRTMLLDFDLRRPGLSKILGLRSEHGLADMLTGAVEPQDQLLRIRDNLAVSLQSTAINDPTQVVMSVEATERLDLLERLYEPDLVIFDLSPMLVTDSTRAVLQHVDCALIVVRADHSKSAQLDVCERDVAENTNVLGVVLNACRHITKSTDYGEYY